MAQETREKKERPGETPKTNEPLELSNEQVREIQQRLDMAEREGVICARDFVTIYQKLGALNPQEKKNATEHLEDYLKVKEKHLELYEEKLEKAVKKNLITEKEKEQRLETYQEMTGEKRKKEDEDILEKWLKDKEKEQRTYLEILEDNPHYAKKGELSKEGEKLLEKYQSLSEKERAREKRTLIKQLKTLDVNVEICEENYEVAKEEYFLGNYTDAVRIVKRNQRICTRYPPSILLQEKAKEAQKSLYNLEYESFQSERIQNIQEDISDTARSGDYEKTLELSKKADDLVHHWVDWTYDGESGRYEPGRPEVKRPERWVTPFMRTLEKKIHEQDEEMKKTYALLKKEEKKEEEEHKIEHLEINKTVAKDSVTQVNIKAATDMAQHLEDADAVDEASKSSSEDGGDDSIYGKGKRIVQHDEADDLTDEELENTVVQIAEHEDGEIEEHEARELLQTETKLELTAKDREISTKRQIQRELNRNMAERELDLLKRLKLQGKISEETYEEEKNRAFLESQMPSAQERAKDILDEQRRTGTLVEAGERGHNALELQEVLQEHHEEEHEGVIDTHQARRQEAQKRKEEMIRKIAA